MAIAPTRRQSLGVLITAAIALCPALTWGGAHAVDRDLIEAAGRGDAAEIARLLAQGATVDARDGANRTALYHATEGNHIAAAVALIEAGADVNASDGASIDHTPYLMAGARGFQPRLWLSINNCNIPKQPACWHLQYNRRPPAMRRWPLPPGGRACDMTLQHVN